ncbi:4-(cytidine 5'-diphospho)-2-C-methyl-D-erythritol kinase [Sneathiella aquimaris]|uniref:4-(cytidine 5'-diphospho)-2-C-methyl-D-erythritol kinase n=1 Tax=Sneathiella aquimaris TaxID=2599305 RepID=UPI00146B5BE2|nr:4-(cytidine 5'-diphospho)-2-C-methyl-D-erythritol kinase [Sneathiella aquimaris]
MKRVAYAPPKVNLFLHVTGKRPDGYHFLESLVCFPRGGDELTLTEDESQLQLFETGPYAAQTGCQSRNLVMRAADLLKRKYSVPTGARFLLQKNLPVASGIGGGSADAAAALLLLNEAWGLNLSKETLGEIGLTLGADVPVCLLQQTAMMRGIGEQVTPVANGPACSILLVNPGISISTPDIFNALTLSGNTSDCPGFEDLDFEQFIEALRACRNDLQSVAVDLAPDIQTVLNKINDTEGCHLARMSGSGATCFGLYKTVPEAEKARAELLGSNPAWWALASHFPHQDHPDDQ